MDERTDAKDTARTEGLSDGVFSIALTLLVLDLTVPRLQNATTGDLAEALHKQLFPLAVLTITFATIFIMWINHHRLFARLHHMDGRAQASNGLLLLLVTICPFPTALAAEYLGQPAGRLAAAVYACYFIVVNIAFNLLIEAAARSTHAERHGLDQAAIARLRKALRFGFFAYAAAALVAIWSAWASLGICALLWLLWARDLFRKAPQLNATS